jgi:hypothetical protein
MPSLAGQRTIQNNLSRKTEQLALHWLDIQSNSHECNLNNTEHNLNNTECSFIWIQDTRGYRTVHASFERSSQDSVQSEASPFSWIQVLDGDGDFDRYPFLPVRDQGLIEKVLQVGLGDQ